MNIKSEYIAYKYEIEPKDNFVVHLINRHPDWNWDWDAISNNPNIPLDFISQKIDEKWNWSRLSNNSNLTIEFILNHDDKKWDMYNLSRNPNIDREKAPHLRWNFQGILSNPNTSLQQIEEYIKKIPFNWCEIWLWTNPNVTEAFLEKHIDKIPDWLSLSLNKNISISFVKKHIDRHWDWKTLSKNIHIDEIRANSHLPWDYDCISENLTLSIPRDVDLILNWTLLSKNPIVTIKCIEDNLNLPWDWKAFALNPNITRDFISKHLEKSFLISDLIQNIGLQCDLTFQKSIQNDIEYRYNEIDKLLNISNDIKTYVLRLYIGYN
jgi:hypothetical protein